MQKVTELSDFEIIDKIVSGESDSLYSLIISRYNQTVATTAMNMLGDMEEAKEIGQQVFIRFYKTLANFKKQASLKTYLTRITINQCLNLLKRNQTFRNRSLELENAFSKSSGSIEKEYESKEVVNKALMYLEEKHRTVIVLRMIQGYSTNETAKILELPKGTVLSRLKRGMDNLKYVLEHNLNYKHG